MIAREIVREAMAQAKHPALMCSFGKESMLLLALMREVRTDFPLLWFRTDRDDNEFAKQMIREWDLQVFSYPPASVYFVSDQTMVYEYSFGQQRFPLVVDVEAGRKCSLNLEQARMSISHVWDALFIGVRDDDFHPVLGQGKEFMPADGWMLDQARVFAPLRGMSEAEVWQAIYELKVPIDPRYEKGVEDVLKVCTQCFTSRDSEVFCPERNETISVHDWNRKASLDGFQQFFGLGENKWQDLSAGPQH